MFTAHYKDGSTAYFVADPDSVRAADGPAKDAQQRQLRGELPRGEIITVKRVR